MAKSSNIQAQNSEAQITARIQPLTQQSPWLLRITDHKDKPSPVLIVKERVKEHGKLKEDDAVEKVILKERGLLYGQPLRRCLPVIEALLLPLTDPMGVPLELHRLVNSNRIEFRGNLPLNEEVGAKLSLLFRLQERVKEMDRIELIALRVSRLTREETLYWLSRATQYGDAGSRWAQAGMRIILGGHPGDSAVQQMLEQLRK